MSDSNSSSSLVLSSPVLTPWFSPSKVPKLSEVRIFSNVASGFLRIHFLFKGYPLFTRECQTPPPRGWNPSAGNTAIWSSSLPPRCMRPLILIWSRTRRTYLWAVLSIFCKWKATRSLYAPMHATLLTSIKVFIDSLLCSIWTKTLILFRVSFCLRPWTQLPQTYSRLIAALLCIYVIGFQVATLFSQSHTTLKFSCFASLLVLTYPGVGRRTVSVSRPNWSTYI